MKLKIKSYMMNTIYYTTDAGFAIPTLVSISSVRKFHPDIRIRVLCSNFSEEQVSYYKKIATKLDFEIIITKKDAISSAIHNTLPNSHVPHTAWNRLLIPEYHDDNTNIVYLDGDTYCVSPLTELLDLPIGENSIYAVPDFLWFSTQRPFLGRNKFGKYVEDLNVSKFYFNSGVFKTSKKFISELRDFVDEVIPLKKNTWRYHDQSAFNEFGSGFVKPLSIKWNFQSSYNYYITEKSVVIHFAGGAKPWLHRDIKVNYVPDYYDIFQTFSNSIFPVKEWSDSQYNVFFLKNGSLKNKIKKILKFPLNIYRKIIISEYEKNTLF